MAFTPSKIRKIIAQILSDNHSPLDHIRLHQVLLDTSTSEMNMISNTRQNWIVGRNVQVGFMTLKVRAILSMPNDDLPEAYILSNMSGLQLYKFVPHNGCQKITVDEAKRMIEENKAFETAVAAARAANLTKAAEINAIFA
jgi:hypothetical protein